MALAPLAARASVDIKELERDTAFESLEGLTQSSVFAVLQDHVGFMWFGTKDGLNRYDGVTIQEYRSISEGPGAENSISDNYVACIYEDSFNNLWIGTLTGGLNLYDPLTDGFTAYLNNPDDPYSVTSNNIQTLCEDKNGNLWVGTADGICMLERSTGRFINFNDSLGQTDRKIWSMCRDQNGDIWMGSNYRLFHVDIDNDYTFTLYRADTANPNSLPNNVVRAVCYSFYEGKHYIWAGTYNGLGRYDVAADEWTHYKYNPNDPHSLSNEKVRSLISDEEGNIWAATPDGLCFLAAGQNEFTVYKHEKGNTRTLTDSALWTVYIDRQGILWIGTFAGGVNMLIDDKQVFGVISHIPGNSQSLDSRYVQSVIRDSNGNLWIGTFDGLNRIDGQTGVFSVYQNDPNDPDSIVGHTIKAIEEDGLGRIWVGSTGGLDLLDPNTGKFIHIALDTGAPGGVARYDGVVTSLVYKDGKIYVGTLFGVNIIDIYTLESHSYQQDILRTFSVNSIMFDSKGYMWLSTNSGLYRFDETDDSYVLFSKGLDGSIDSLSSNKVEATYEDSRGNIWICTSHGLDRITIAGGKGSETYTFNHYLRDMVVHNALEGGLGYIFFSTNNGLYRFDYTAASNVAFIYFDTYNGLPANEFSENAAFQDINGVMYFGGINGLVFFEDKDVENLAGATPEFKVVITDFRMRDNQKLTTEQPIWDVNEVSLKYGDNSFSISFTAFDYVVAQNIRYGYILEGFDDKDTLRVTDSSDRVASYTNLPAGKYTLRIFCIDDNDQVYPDSEKRLTITIVPPFWQTWWFIAVCIFAVMAAIWFIVWARTKAVSVQRERLEVVVDERTQELKAAYKKELNLNERLANEIDQRITFNRALVHELKTPLTPMIATSELLTHIYKEEPINGYASNILDGALSLNKRIDELLDVAKSETGMLSINKKKLNLSKLGQDMYAYMLPRFSNNGVQFTYEDNGQDVTVQADKDRMKQVMINLLDNAAKHTKKNDTVVLSIWKEGNKAFLSVKDSGEGIPKEQQRAIFDTYTSAKKRLTKFDGLGLGLYLVHQIVTKHDGTIVVNSEKGEGTEFVVTLPLGAAEKK